MEGTKNAHLHFFPSEGKFRKILFRNELECILLFRSPQFLPEGHSTMDKALACLTGGPGLNLDMIKDFFNS